MLFTSVLMVRLGSVPSTRTLAILLYITLVPSALAQDEPCSRRIVSVTVADRNWTPASDLKPGDFHAEYRGEPVRIVSVVPDTGRHRIVIVMDASGTLGPEVSPGKWQLALALASHLAASGMPNTSFGLLIFNDSVREQIDFSQRSGAVAERLRQIGADSRFQKTSIRGKTALWDAVITGSALLPDPTPADAFYLITDGGENASRAGSSEVRRRLAISGCRVFVALLAAGPFGNRSPTPEESNGPLEMDEIAHSTGGALFGPVMQVPSGIGLASGDFDQKLTALDALRRFYQTILGGYRVEIQLPKPVDKWREWKLGLSKERAAQLKHAQVGYTRDLAPCSGQK